MEKEATRKIAWLEKRHAEQHLLVEQLESKRSIDRSDVAKSQLAAAKKEKLRLKDMIEWMKSIEKQKS